MSRAKSDTLWLTSQSLVIMGIGVVSTALAARVYGPETMGYITYAVAYASLFAPLARLGLDSILIHEFLSKPQQASRTLWTAITLRSASSVMAAMAIWLTLSLIDGGASNHLWGTIIGLSVFTTVGEAFLSALQARGHIKIGAISRIVASMLTAALRISVLLLQLPIIWFVASYAFDAALVTVSMLAAYAFKSRFPGPHGISATQMRLLLSRGWPLIASGLAIALYSRIDQVMISIITGSSASTALYGAAATLAEIWYFVPTAVITVLQVKIMAEKSSSLAFAEKTLQLYGAVAAISLAICLAMTVLAWPIMWLVFGSQYVQLQSVASIVILSWAGLFAMLGAARSPWMIVQELQRFSMIYLVLGCVLNVILNLISIPLFGIVGAALATFVAQVFVALVAPLIFAETRPAVTHILHALSFAGLKNSRHSILAALPLRKRGHSND